MHKLVTETTEENFEQDVVQSPELVLIDFWAPWCVPCRALEPVLADVAEQYVGRVKIVKVNVDTAPSLAKRFAVRGIPAVYILQNAQVVSRISAYSRVGVRAALDQALSLKSENSRYEEKADAPHEPTTASNKCAFQDSRYRKAIVLYRLRHAFNEGLLGSSPDYSPSIVAAGGVGDDQFVTELGIYPVLGRIIDVIYAQLNRQNKREVYRMVVALFGAIPLGVDLASALLNYYDWLLDNQAWGLVRYVSNEAERSQFRRLKSLHALEEQGTLNLPDWRQLNDDVCEYVAGKDGTSVRLDIGVAIRPRTDMEHAGLEDFHSYMESLATRVDLENVDWSAGDMHQLRALQREAKEKIVKNGDVVDKEVIEADSKSNNHHLLTAEYADLLERYDAYLFAVSQREIAFNRAAADVLLSGFSNCSKV